ncbi:ABC transporter permease [Pasteuria penetrans]|uniref:ABC transporter permease n=1 Tax=Pasteuria penetrans TaxID=86005 RepID=UPI000F984A9E|nr:ABC transporter permease subunit [Pasteuria penetrans]
MDLKTQRRNKNFPYFAPLWGSLWSNPWERWGLPIFCSLLSTLCVLALWIGIAGGIPGTEKFQFPTPMEVLGVLQEDPDLWLGAMKTTLFLCILGTLISIFLGIVLTILLYLLPTLKRFLHPILVSTKSIPMYVVAPMLVFPLGQSKATGVIVVVLVTFLPVFISMGRGMQQVDPVLYTYLEIAGASRWQRLIHLALPSSLGACLSGIELALISGVNGAVLAESIGAGQTDGIGYIARESSHFNFHTGRLFAAALLLVLTTLVLLFMVHVVSYLGFRRLKKWQGALG